MRLRQHFLIFNLFKTNRKFLQKNFVSSTANSHQFTKVPLITSMYTKKIFNGEYHV